MSALKLTSFVSTVCLRAGYVTFNDEAMATLRLADGMLLAVDACEGVTPATEGAIKQAILEDLPICLIVTKVRKLQPSFRGLGSKG